MSVTWQNNPYTATGVHIENTVIISEAVAVSGVLYVVGEYSGRVYYTQPVNAIAGETYVNVAFDGNLVDANYIAKFEYDTTVEESDPLNVAFNIDSSSVMKNIIASVGRYLENGLSDVEVYSSRISDEILNNLSKPVIVFSVSGLNFESDLELGDSVTIDLVTLSIVGVSTQYAQVYDLYDRLLELVLRYPVHVVGVGDLKMNHKVVDFDVSTESDKDIYFFNAMFDFRVLYD